MSLGSVLLVEDNDDLRFFHGNMIREWGYEVTVAEHGKQAIQILQSGVSIDIVVTDFQMPELNGAGLIAWIADSGLHFQSVILLTSMYDDDPEIQSLEKDVAAKLRYTYLHKTEAFSLRRVLQDATPSQ